MPIYDLGQKLPYEVSNTFSPNITLCMYWNDLLKLLGVTLWSKNNLNELVFAKQNLILLFKFRGMLPSIFLAKGYITDVLYEFYSNFLPSIFDDSSPKKLNVLWGIPSIFLVHLW